jgi:3-hydroxyisobutyrate dehydrogenase
MTDNAQINVTVLGTGTMGTPMATNLVRHGFSTTVWDRNPASTRPLGDAGAHVAAAPREAVARADVLISMLPSGEAVESVFDHQGVLDAMLPGSVWAQMGTIGVAATDRMAALARARRTDVTYVDAPVSGSKGPAESGELIVLASGPDEVREVMDPVFAALGRRTVWLGEAGRGMRMKVVLNAWLAFVMEGLAETLTLADDLGVEHAQLFDVLDGSPLAAPWAVSKAHKIDSGDYSAEFALEWALKDVDLALNSVLDRLPALAAISQQWHRAEAEGYGRLDLSAARLALGTHA